MGVGIPPLPLPPLPGNIDFGGNPTFNPGLSPFIPASRGLTQAPLITSGQTSGQTQQKFQTNFGNTPFASPTPSTSPASSGVCPGAHQAFLQIIAELIFVVVLSVLSEHNRSVERLSIGLLAIMFVLYGIVNGGQFASKAANFYQYMLGLRQTN